MRWFLLLCTVFPIFWAQATTPIPEHADAFLVDYCLDCHDSDSEKGGINLDFFDIDWKDKEAYQRWERVIDVLHNGDMPPAEKTQPKTTQVAEMTKWLDTELLANALQTGTAPRRLNRTEYLESVRILFGIGFDLPPGFPADQLDHGFDNQAEALILSPPLMEAYGQSADLIADIVFPPPRKAIPSRLTKIAPADMTISYSSASVRDNSLRLAMKCDTITRSCSWPAKFETKASGTYRIKLDLSAFRPIDNNPLIFQLRSYQASSNSVKAQRLLGEFEVGPGAPQSFEVTADLYKGETLLFHYANALFDSTKQNRKELEGYFRGEFEKNPRFLAAMLSIKRGNSIRGGLGWDRIKAKMTDPELDLTKISRKATDSLIREITGNPVLYAETLAFRIFEEGPAMSIHHVEIEGPLSLIEGPEERKQAAIQERFLGEQGERSQETWGRQALTQFLTKAFRRPASKEEVQAYWQIVAEHLAKGHPIQEGMHLAIRTGLRSPHFLYRELNSQEQPNRYELASRLSYFLTLRPPDYKLRTTDLSDPDIREQEARRLLKSGDSKDFITTFVSQWLHTQHLADIMPDPRLVNFTENDRRNLERELEQLFTEILRKNRPVSDFIDPDFVYTSENVAKKIYGFDQWTEKAKKDAITRVSLERGGRHGGVIGSAAVLMATANGVDTQPVLRGVWMLENILGNPPPPPPDAVPAITPDTRGAETIRDLLEAHTADPKCAGCHKMMDPLGLVLENFDAVGRWRETYPVYQADAKGKIVEKPGAPINATGSLPDGTQLQDVIDLKNWLLENIDVFANCLSEKILTSATGRTLNYAERHEIRTIVEQHLAQEEGFEDLFIALVRSETFRS